MAGAASRKVSAAAGCTPERMSCREVGTDAHSQPGNSMPAAPATGTAAAARRGSRRATMRGGTKAAMAADTATPNARNGTA